MEEEEMYPAPPPAPPQKPWYQRGWSIALGAVLVLGFIGSIVSDDDDASVTASENVVERRTVETDDSLASSVVPPPAAPAPSTQVAPAPAPVPVPVVTWAMPDMTGSNLQSAQDAMQALTGNLLFFSTSTDLTGQGRAQVLDGNWRVCSQNIPAGTAFDASAQIDFGVVKNEESCP